jgi:hypothetical protein
MRHSASRLTIRHTAGAAASVPSPAGDTFAVRIEGEITSRLSVRVLKNRSSGSERNRGSESALSPVKRMRLRRTNSPTAPILKPVATGAQPRYTNVSSASPNTIAPTKKLMTVNPITRRRLIPAIAKTGKAQNGWIMLATCSPMATAMAVAACDVCS